MSERFTGTPENEHERKLKDALNKVDLEGFQVGEKPAFDVQNSRYIREQGVSGSYEEITLYTANFNKAGFVRLPIFGKRPEVLIWGARVFIRKDEPVGGGFTYIEGFAYAIPEGFVDPLNK